MKPSGERRANTEACGMGPFASICRRPRLRLSPDSAHLGRTVHSTSAIDRHQGGPRNGCYGILIELSQSALMLAARITFAHFSASLARNFLNSAGGLGGSTNPPRSTRRALMAGSEIAKLISLLSRSTTAAGVLFGTPKPSHEIAS